MVDQDVISDAIKTICETHWAAHKAPLLLSALPPLLEKVVSSYRSSLKPRTLKSFIKETGQGKYQLIEHPTQRVRVGVIPAEVEYAFPSPERVTNKINPETPKVVASKSRETTLAFLKILSNLSEEEISSVSIPVTILVKLLK